MCELRGGDLHLSVRMFTKFGDAASVGVIICHYIIHQPKQWTIITHRIHIWLQSFSRCVCKKKHATVNCVCHILKYKKKSIGLLVAGSFNQGTIRMKKKSPFNSPNPSTSWNFCSVKPLKLGLSMTVRKKKSQRKVSAFFKTTWKMLMLLTRALFLGTDLKIEFYIIIYVYISNCWMCHKVIFQSRWHKQNWWNFALFSGNGPMVMFFLSSVAKNNTGRIIPGLVGS